MWLALHLTETSRQFYRREAAGSQESAAHGTRAAHPAALKVGADAAPHKRAGRPLSAGSSASSCIQKQKALREFVLPWLTFRFELAPDRFDMAYAAQLGILPCDVTQQAPFRRSRTGDRPSRE